MSGTEDYEGNNKLGKVGVAQRAEDFATQKTYKEKTVVFLFENFTKYHKKHDNLNKKRKKGNKDFSTFSKFHKKG